MSRVALGRFGAHSAKIRNLALDIVNDAHVPEKDKRGELDAIHAWVQNHLRYVNDPVWMEFITQPETLAFDRTDGDCDDHAVLEAALLGAIGFQTRFVTVAPKPGPFSHVYLQALVMSSDGTGQGLIRREWVNLDPIVKQEPAGWAVPNPYRIKIYPVNTPQGIGLQSTESLLTTLAGVAGFLLKL